jgi:WD40 repeat protein
MVLTAFGAACIPLRVIMATSDGDTACAVMPDGRRVVSASNGKTLKVWDFKRACA